MKTENFLNLADNFTQHTSKFPEPTFECDEKYIDWNKDIFNQPRKLTIKNIRDIFFSILNQSQA